MSGSVNKVIIVGNLGDDPQIKRTQDGRAIANMSIATTETWRDRNSGEHREKTEWHRVVCFSDGLNKVIEQYVKKGQTVYIEGQLQTRRWQDQNGNDRYTTEVVIQNFGGTLQMIGGRSNESQQQQDNSGYDPAQSSQRPLDYGAASGGTPAGEMDSEIPFAPEWRG